MSEGDGATAPAPAGQADRKGDAKELRGGAPRRARQAMLPPPPLPIRKLKPSKIAVFKSILPLRAPAPGLVSYSPPQPEPYDACPDRQKLIEAMQEHDHRRTRGRKRRSGPVRNDCVYDIDELYKRAKADGRMAADRSGPVKPYYEVDGKEDTTLVFESRFEGGNLRRAVRVRPTEYDLVVRPDLNTSRHTQWYFFSISNTRKCRYKFNMINMQKPDSLYNWGMRPLMFSRLAARERGIRGRRRETETRSAAQIAARTVAKHNASVRARHREAQDSAPRPLVQFVSPTALRATDRGGNFASDVLRRRVGRQAAAASPVGHAARDPAQLHHARGQDAAHSRFWPHVQILRHIPREARPRIRDVRGPGT